MGRTFHIDLVGTDGVTKSTEDVPITVTVSGAGSLLALGSAKPNMEECFFADTHTTYYGKALAVIRTGMNAAKSISRQVLLIWKINLLN